MFLKNEDKHIDLQGVAESGSDTTELENAGVYVLHSESSSVSISSDGDGTDPSNSCNKAPTGNDIIEL